MDRRRRQRGAVDDEGGSDADASASMFPYYDDGDENDEYAMLEDESVTPPPAMHAMTQNDIIEWDESKNVSVRSPNYRTPSYLETPSDGSPSTRTTSKAALTTGGTRTRRKSSLNEVARRLPAAGMRSSTELANFDPNKEVDSIFDILEDEKEGTVAGADMAPLLPLPSDATSSSTADSTLHSRKRRRQLLLQQQQMQPTAARENNHNLGYEELSSLPVTRRSRRTRRNRMAMISNNNSVRAPADDGVSVVEQEAKLGSSKDNGANEFEQLLHEIQHGPFCGENEQQQISEKLPAADSSCDEATSRKARFHHSPPEVTSSALTNSTNQSNSNTRDLYAETTTTTKSAKNAPQPSNQDSIPSDIDEFGGLNFSMEDLDKMDALVQQAAQNEGANGAASSAHEPIPIPPVTTSSGGNDDDDPFGDFPDLDFDALDKSIAQHSSHGPVTGAAEAVPVQSPLSDVAVLTFSRYRVMRVEDDVSTATKTLSVAKWHPSMLQVSCNTGSSSSISHPRRIVERLMPSSNDDSKASQWPSAGVVLLRGEWYHTHVVEMDDIHICSLSGKYRTDALPLVLNTNDPQHGQQDDLVLIVHPDILLTPTGISETTSCTRRSIIKSRLGSTGLSCTLFAVDDVADCVF